MIVADTGAMFLSFGNLPKSDPLKDPVIRSILKQGLPAEFTMVPGNYFKKALFPREVLDALTRHPQITHFQAEEAIFTTDIQDDLEELISYIFNTHPYLTGKMGEGEPDIIQVLLEIEDSMAAEGVASD